MLHHHRRHRSRHHNSQHRSSQHHVLEMSSLQENNDSGQQQQQQPNKKRKLLAKLNPIKLLLKLFYQMNKTQSNLRTKFKSLSKKGKVLFTVQLMTLMIIFGVGTNQLITNIANARGGSTAATATRTRVARSRPVEVPYSVFMDMVEKSGKVSEIKREKDTDVDVDVDVDRYRSSMRSKSRSD